MSSRQHHKGKKRPRDWHRGRAQGAINDVKLQAFEQAEHEGRTREDELRAVAARYNEDVEVWQAAMRASPFVPHFEVAL